MSRNENLWLPATSDCLFVSSEHPRGQTNLPLSKKIVKCYLLVTKLRKKPYCPTLKLILELYNFYIFHCLKLTTCCCKKTTNVLCNRLHKNCYYKLRDFVSGKTFTWLERLQQITNFLYYLIPLCFLRNNQSLYPTERME